MQRRAPLRRSTPLRAKSRLESKSQLRRSGPIARRTPLRAVNPVRRQQRFEDAFHSVAFVTWIKSLSCSVQGCRSRRIEAPHVSSRGAGGTYEDVVPLCSRHHRESHDVGIRTFERRYGLDLVQLAGVIADRWRERQAA